MTTVNEVLEETAINEGRNVSSEGNYEPAVVKARKQREFTKLEKIEAGLRRARAAIKEAKFLNQTHDPDLVPSGPMYWNAKAFHRLNFYIYGLIFSPVLAKSFSFFNIIVGREVPRRLINGLIMGL